MAKSWMIVAVLCLTAVAKTVAFCAENDDDYVTAERKQGRCTLHDFQDQPHDYQHGLKLWFGTELSLRCTYCVKTTDFIEKRNELSAGGMVRGGVIPLYYGYNVAFFDAHGEMIASAGGHFPDRGPVEEGLTSVTRMMPIPVGLYRKIDSYRVAYYESNKGIGKVVWNEHQPLVSVSHNGDTGEITETTYPAWKSDGELASERFQVRAGSRLVFAEPASRWQAQTKADKCALPKQKTDDKVDDEEVRLNISIGEKLGMQADCRFTIDEDNAIKCMYRFVNPSEKKLHGQLYIAFFDQHGNLVCGTEIGSTVKAKKTSPEVTVTGDPAFRILSHDTRASTMPMPIPAEMEKKITSYQMTFYVSERPIGDVSERGEKAK